MARPTTQQQNIVKIRNGAIIDLCLRKGFSQAEVARFFNMHRAAVNQIIKEAEAPKKLGDKLLKEYVISKIKKAEKGVKDDYVSVLGLSWRSSRPVSVDYLMSDALGRGEQQLWDEIGEDKKKSTRVEDIVISHKGYVLYVIRFGETFSEDEYPGVTKISIPTGLVLSQEDLTDLSEFIV